VVESNIDADQANAVPANELYAWLQAWPDGLISVDECGNVLYFSPRATEFLGWTMDDVKNQHIHDLVCVHSRELTHTRSECPLCDLNPDAEQTHSTWWLAKSGEYVSVDYRLISLEKNPSGQRIFSFYDNQSRSHSYREMVKYTEYVDQSPTPIAEFDGEGQLLFGNPALQTLLLEFGFDETGTARIWPSNLAELCDRAWREQQILNDVEISVEQKWFRWHFHPVASTATVSVMAYLFDITEQKIAELRLAEEQRAARRDFFAKMVHELRTPLNAIIGFSQILIKRSSHLLDERDLSSLRAIRTAGLQLNDMVTDTLDAAKLDAGKLTLQLEQFRLIEVIDSIREQIAALAETKKLNLSIECDAELIICSDAKKIRQVLLNLVGNAIKYTHQGKVDVRVFLGAATEESPEQWITLEVADTGVGMSEQQQQKLFQVYQQIDEDKNRGIQGTGIGLALVAEMIKLLQGKIDVESKPDQGSIFRVLLPLAISSAPTDSQNP
jgi:two-component system, autoinducer 2 sensor kinase/phosphatase LuxQ